MDLYQASSFGGILKQIASPQGVLGFEARLRLRGMISSVELPASAMPCAQPSATTRTAMPQNIAKPRVYRFSR